MKKVFWVITILGIMFLGDANAMQIVYPSSQNTKINSPITAFIGNEHTKNLKINGETVKIHPSGGFKHAVKLKYGDNTFNISNGTETKVYKITRPYTQTATASIMQLTEYKTPIMVETIKDNSPLRSTPVDAGLNRLQHLQKGIPLKAVGENKNFYKVELAKGNYAWISKSNTEKSNNNTFGVGVIESLDFDINDKSETYKFKLSDKLPYVFSESGAGFDLVIYGLNKEIYPSGKYELHISRDSKKFGYSSEYRQDNELVIKINRFIPDIKKITITIDPGHGGNEKGTTGCLGNKEKDFNLKIAKKLQNKLKESGANVVMTRTTDTYVSLQDRVKISNDNNAQIFISIHANALPDSLLDRDIRGTEVYYFYPQSKELAQKVLSSINEKTGNTNGKVKGESFAVVRNTNAICILVETGYMIDPEENSKLVQDNYQEKITDGIIKGLERFLSDI